MSAMSQVRIFGPLVPYGPGFAAELAERGYSDLGAAQQLRLLADLSRWLDAEDVALADVVSGTVEAFLVSRRDRGRRQWVSPAGLVPLLGHLRAVGAIPVVEPVADDSPKGRLLDSYRCYLVEERGVRPTTVVAYMAVARRFLDGGDGDVGGLSARDVAGFVVSDCARHRAAGVVTALRCLLRYLYFEGHISAELVWAVPRAASWSAASLPRAVAPDSVARLLASCDTSRAIGRRDFAIITLIVRLGVRAGEVAGLSLDDIDWRSGDVLIDGKGGRAERLPLPADVGAAIAVYVRDGRPGCEYRQVFLRARAPWGPMSQPGITTIVYEACRRAGVPRVGAHALRHSAATQMLQRGATLAEVGQVLRHHDLLTTSGYAKVDRIALRELALPWPGEGR